MKTLISSIFLCLTIANIIRVEAQDPEAVWSTIAPSTDLAWSSCYTTFECARFQVPLDWNSPADNATVVIALIRVPSTYARTDKAYRGPILFNFGGPGILGIDSILSMGPAFQKMLGEEFDIVSFDPRGFGRTTPTLRPYADASEHSALLVKTWDDPPFGETPGALARTYARFQAWGVVMKSRIGDVAPYVSTPLVARDMLAITQAAGFPKLKYWGISYGTVLGMTYATMFPDNVERLMLDGVVNGTDYYLAQWSHNLYTTDQAVERFADACAKVGPERCALHESSGKKVLARIHKIFDAVKRAPIPVVVGNGPADYGIVDYGMVRITVFRFFTKPFAIPSQNFALMLAGLEHGNGTLLWQTQVEPSHFYQCKSGPDTFPADLAFFAPLGIPAVACGDAKPVTDSLPTLQKWYEDNTKQSSFAELWNFRVLCAGWKIRPAEQFKGKLGANMSFPILFVGNVADVTTPLRNAQGMSELFPGSGVLAIDTPGHSSLATVSACASRAMRAYFQDGILPQPGTICDIDLTFFEASNATTTAVRAHDDFTQAIHHITEHAQIPQLVGI